MLKVSGRMLAKHYGIHENVFQMQLRKQGKKINNLPDLIDMIIYYELENRQRKDKSRKIVSHDEIL